MHYYYLCDRLSIMEFSTVVRQIQQLHIQQQQHHQQEKQSLQEFPETYQAPEVGVTQDLDVIYGRVCTTGDGSLPALLSSDSERKSIFVFGPDAIQSVLLKLPVSEVLYSLGWDKQYLHHKVQWLTV